MRGGSSARVPSEFSGDKTTRKLNVSWKKVYWIRKCSLSAWETGSGGGRLCLCAAVEPRLLFHILGPGGLDERVGMVTGLLTFSLCRLPGDRELEGVQEGCGGARSWALSWLNKTFLWFVSPLWHVARQEKVHTYLLPLLLYDSLKLYSGFKQLKPKIKVFNNSHIETPVFSSSQEKIRWEDCRSVHFSHNFLLSLFTFKHKYLNPNSFRTDSLL